MDVRSICAIISVVLSLCTFIGGLIAFCIIRLNDFVHIEKNFEKSQLQFEEFKKEVTMKLDILTGMNKDNEKSIAIINERCRGHKIIKRRKL